jgi:surfactin synthase thioesterase subunit
MVSSDLQPGKWLLRRPREDSAARLFCFPYSGAGASMYKNWPETIGAAEVCRIQPPGRENRTREPHYGTYEALAEQLAVALADYLDRPFGFFGHCSSALIGCAVAAHFHQVGLPMPACLFISSQEPPHLGPYSRFLDLGNADLASELGRIIKAMGGRPTPELVQLGLKVLRSDISAARQYHLESPVRLPTSIRTIIWKDDEEIRPDQMVGWDEYADSGKFHETVLEGGHYTFLSAPIGLMQELAQGMSEALAGRQEHDEPSRT